MDCQSDSSRSSSYSGTGRSHSASRKSSFSRKSRLSKKSRASVNIRNHQTKYIAKSRVERLKLKVIPKSHSYKLVVASNLEGNGFRWHNQDIDNLMTDEQTRFRIRSCIKELNNECYNIWKSKKIALEGTHLRNQQYGLTAVSVLVLALVLLLALGFDFSETIEICLLTGILLSIAVIFGLTLSVYSRQYRENSMEVEIKNRVRQKLSQYNKQYFFPKKMKWKSTKDCFWICLKLIDNEDSKFRLL